MLSQVVERCRAVDESLVLDGQLRRVLMGGVAEVRVSGAKRHIDETIIVERIIGAGEVEHPTLVCWIFAINVRVIIRSCSLAGRP